MHTELRLRVVQSPAQLLVTARTNLMTSTSANSSCGCIRKVSTFIEQSMANSGDFNLLHLQSKPTMSVRLFPIRRRPNQMIALRPVGIIVPPHFPFLLLRRVSKIHARWPLHLPRCSQACVDAHRPILWPARTGHRNTCSPQQHPQHHQQHQWRGGR